jgi:hypothetical protein
MVETSEIMESGDEAVDVERAREDRRVRGGMPSRLLQGLLVGQGRDSITRRDKHMF